MASDDQRRILEMLLATIPGELTLDALQVGLFWTMARTRNGMGMAVTPVGYEGEAVPFGSAIEGAGALLGTPIRELERPEGSMYERAITLAAINAGLSEKLTGDADEPAASVIARHGEGKRIAFIGHFPTADRLRDQGFDVEVFELSHRLQAGDTSSDELRKRLPRADVVAITAATLVTRSTEEVLRCVRPDAFTLMLGPSTPLHPLLWEWGFDALCGTVVDEPNAAFLFASQGATHRQMRGLRKVTCYRGGAA